MSSEAWEHYDVPYAPYFVYVSGPAGRVVGEGVAAGWEEVRTLVANAVADGTTAAAARRRRPAGPARGPIGPGTSPSTEPWRRPGSRPVIPGCTRRRSTAGGRRS